MKMGGIDDVPFPQRATLPLNFIVVGGSITGLACAYNLQAAGHTVRVLEKGDGVGTVCLHSNVSD